MSSASQVNLLPKAKEALRKKPKAKSKNRKIWLYLCWVLSWFIPDRFLIWAKMNTHDVRQAWREKFVLCMCVFLASVTLIVWLEGLTKLVCPPITNYPLDAFLSEDINAVKNTKDLFIANGRIYNSIYSSKSKDVVEFINFAQTFTRLDATPVFPTSARVFSPPTITF